MEKIELNEFYNDGFGWICKSCERELKKRAENFNQKHSRLMREGEAESKEPNFSNSAIAKWADKAHFALFCPRCGVTESAEKIAKW